MFSNKFNTDQIDKLGNAIRYLAKDTPLSKTKLLKLIYLLEEISIKKYGIPFFNFSFYVWKFGPVVPEIFVDLSSQPSLLKDYIDRINEDSNSYITAKGAFCDDEFSDNDMEVLSLVSKFKSLSAEELIKFTHRENSPWYDAAKKHGILEQLENEEISTTEFPVNVASLISYDAFKSSIYNSYVELYGNPIKTDCECLNHVH